MKCLVWETSYLLDRPTSCELGSTKRFTDYHSSQYDRRMPEALFSFGIPSRRRVTLRSGRLTDSAHLQPSRRNVLSHASRPLSLLVSRRGVGSLGRDCPDTYCSPRGHLKSRVPVPVRLEVSDRSGLRTITSLPTPPGDPDGAVPSREM